VRWLGKVCIGRWLRRARRGCPEKELHLPSSQGGSCDGQAPVHGAQSGPVGRLELPVEAVHRECEQRLLRMKTVLGLVVDDLHIHSAAVRRRAPHHRWSNDSGQTAAVNRRRGRGRADCGPSSTSPVCSSPRMAGRQFMKIASFLASFMVSAVTCSRNGQRRA